MPYIKEIARESRMLGILVSVSYLINFFIIIYIWLECYIEKNYDYRRQMARTLLNKFGWCMGTNHRQMIGWQSGNTIRCSSWKEISHLFSVSVAKQCTIKPMGPWTGAKWCLAGWLANVAAHPLAKWRIWKIVYDIFFRSFVLSFHFSLPNSIQKLK